MIDFNKWLIVKMLLVDEELGSCTNIVARLGISTVKVIPAAFLYDEAKGRIAAGRRCDLLASLLGPR